MRASAGRLSIIAALAAFPMIGCGPAPAEDHDGGVREDADVLLPDGGMPGSDGGGDGGADGGTDAGPAVEGADPTFGAGGLSLVNVANEWMGFVWSVALQPDGKIVAGGRTSDAFVVVRALPDGTLDRSFGTGGMASVPTGRFILAPTTVLGLGGIALAPDGSIVVATLVLDLATATQRELVARLTPSGALDASFGDGGVVVGDYTVPEGAVANAVAVQPDGRIVVAARDHVDRLLPDGSPDPSFGSAGSFADALGGFWADYQALAIDDEGRIVVSGVQGSSSGIRVVVMRLTSAGALDASFAGGAGHVFDSVASGGLGSTTRARSVAIDGAGRIVVGAMRTPSRATLSVGRFTASGALDASFGDGGWASADDGVSYVGTSALVAVQSDDRIVAAGGSGVGGQPAPLVRFTEDGAIDTTFGEGGVGGFDRYYGPLGLALAADDSIVVSGFGSGGALHYIARLDRDGAADTAFAGDGSLEPPTNAGFDRALAAVVQPDGKIVLGGTGTALNLGALVRLEPDGTIDASFGTGGRVTRAGLDGVTSMALDASGRVLYSGPGDRLRVVRMLPDGSADPSFGDAGAFSYGSTRCANMAMGADGRVYVAGYAHELFGDSYLGVKRLLDDGTADPSFGTGGEVLVPLAREGTTAVLAVQADGQVVVSGSVLLRLDADGALDPSFGTAGIAVGGSGAQAIAIADDGAIVLAFHSTDSSRATTLIVERRLADGSLDPAFGEGGRAEVPAGEVSPWFAGVLEPVGLSLEDDGTILIAGSIGDDEGMREDAMLLRLASDGSPDTTFGDGGRRVLPLGRGSSRLHAIVRDGEGRTLLVGRAYGDASATTDLMALRLR